MNFKKSKYFQLKLNLALIKKIVFSQFVNLFKSRARDSMTHSVHLLVRWLVRHTCTLYVVLSFSLDNRMRPRGIGLIYGLFN